MPTTPEDLRNLNILSRDVFEETWKNFEEVTKGDTEDRCFDEGHFDKDKIPIAEIDNDPVDPSHEDEKITVDVIPVIKVIGEKKRRPLEKLELPNDHDKKGPKLHDDHNSKQPMEKIPSKMDVGVKGKMDTHNIHLSFDEVENDEQIVVNSPLKKSRSRPRPLNDHSYLPLKMIGIIKEILGSTLYVATKSILLCVILAVLIYMFFASARENEPRDLQPRQLTPGKRGDYNQFREGQDSEDSQQSQPFTGNNHPKRYPTPPVTEDENSGQDAAKWKTLHVWIRKALEKMEREKQKKIEREQMEQERKEAEKEQEEAKKEAMNDMTNDSEPQVPMKSQFESNGDYNQYWEGQDSEDSQQSRPFTGNHHPNRYPTPPRTEDKNSGLDAAKRKTLHVWIRKALEKMEREKQKKIEREQMEQERKEAEKEQEEAKKEAMNDMTNDGKPHVPKKSRFDTDDEEDESSLPLNPVKNRSRSQKRVKRKSPSPEKFKSEKKKQMDFTSKCNAHRTPVLNISASFYKNLGSCESELDRLGCKTDLIRACISDWKGHIWAVCTEDLCLPGDACPVVTFEIDQNTKLPKDRVVQSIDEVQCRNCTDSDSLKKRWQQGNNSTIRGECIKALSTNETTSSSRPIESTTKETTSSSPPINTTTKTTTSSSPSINPTIKENHSQDWISMLAKLICGLFILNAVPFVFSTIISYSTQPRNGRTQHI